MVKQGLDASHRLIRVIVWSQQRYCWQGGGMRPPVLAERVSMEHSDEPELASEAVAPVNDIFDAVELASAVNIEEFKHFLDHVPIAVIVSKSLRGEHRIVYANKAFEPNLECQPFGAAVGNTDRRLLTAPIGGASQGP